MALQSVQFVDHEPAATTRGVRFTLGAQPKVLLENLASEGDAVFTKITLWAG